MNKIIESIAVNEKKRTYVFSGGNCITYENVIAICVRKSGIHRISLADGRKVIVSSGWLAIEIEGINEWTF